MNINFILFCAKYTFECVKQMFQKVFIHFWDFICRIKQKFFMLRSKVSSVWLYTLLNYGVLI